MPQYPLDYSNRDALRAAFSWQTRVGLAPKWGTCNVQHYQCEQVAVADEIARRVTNLARTWGVTLPLRVKCSQDVVLAYVGAWRGLGTIRDVLDAARKADKSKG